jgi:TrmH family RNA methyltransferase
MLSKIKIKFINSLQKNKIRGQNCLFIVEGSKLVIEMICSSYKIQEIIATSDWIDNNHEIIKNLTVTPTKTADLERISNLSSPPEALAIIEMPEQKNIENIPVSNLILVLQDIQNPGNLGTIIRTADWFGIQSIVCSLQTADVYNPKVIQASMGSLSRVDLYYTDLIDFLKRKTDNSNIPVYGTFLDGRNIYNEKLSSQGIIIIGNEGQGISKELQPFINQRLLIPAFPAGQSSAESLNAAIATAIICSEFRRRME